MPLQWWDTTASFSTGVPFAIDSTGSWRDVDDVQRGKACGCYCAACHGPLIARHGEVRIHHFAHDDRKECRQALEASLFGMAMEILRQPGAQLRLPAPYDVASMIRAADAEAYQVTAAMKVLGLTPLQSTFTLARPVSACAQLNEARRDFPEIVDGDQDFALHLLTTSKMLYMLEHVHHTQAQVLAINALAFAHGWYESVCDPDREERVAAATQAKDQFKRWLAKSVEGRGWLVHPEERRVATLLKRRIEATRVRYVHPTPLFAPVRLASPAQWTPPPVPTAKPKPPPAPEGPDQVLELAVETCRQCRSPMDVILQGSGLFAGKRLVVCRAHPRHAVKHLG